MNNGGCFQGSALNHASERAHRNTRTISTFVQSHVNYHLHKYLMIGLEIFPIPEPV